MGCSLDARGPRSEKQPQAAAGPHRLAEGRQVDDPQRDPVVVLEGEEVGVERHAARERLGAVDRIEDPPPTGGAGGRGLLLSEHPVSGEQLGQPLAQEPLRVAVGGGDRRAVALALHLEVDGAEPPEGALPRLPQQGDRRLQRLLIDRRPVHVAESRTPRRTARPPVRWPGCA